MVESFGPRSRICLTLTSRVSALANLICGSYCAGLRGAILAAASEFRKWQWMSTRRLRPFLSRSRACVCFFGRAPLAGPLREAAIAAWVCPGCWQPGVTQVNIMTVLLQ